MKQAPNLAGNGHRPYPSMGFWLTDFWLTVIDNLTCRRKVNPHSHSLLGFKSQYNGVTKIENAVEKKTPENEQLFPAPAYISRSPRNSLLQPLAKHKTYYPAHSLPGKRLSLSWKLRESHRISAT